MPRTVAKLLIFTLVLSLSLMPSKTALADTPSSTNYIITSDSLNCGGDYGTSTNYTLFDTICETAAGDASAGSFSTSSSYTIGSGFQDMKDIEHITVTISTSTVTFGTVSTSTVSTATVDVTVTTNAENGYQATITEDGELRTSNGGAITDISDGTVSAGGDEYGFRTSNPNGENDGQFNATDTSITSAAKTFAQKTSWASAVLTRLTFKIGISVNNVAGDYSHTLTIVTTGSF